VKFWTVFEATGWTAAACGATAIVWAAAVPVGETSQQLASADDVPSVEVARAFFAESLVNTVIQGDLFRPERAEPVEQYQPGLEHHEMVAPYEEVPRPNLRLVGFIDAARPTALIRGFWGRDYARVVREGETIDGLLIKRIREGRVEVVGMDTVWVLTVRDPWN